MDSRNELYNRRYKKGENILLFSQDSHVGVKGKAIPVQAWTDPEGSRRLRLPDFKTIATWRCWSCQPYAPAVLTPRKYLWCLFLWIAESTSKHSAAGRIMSMKNSNDTIGNRTRDLPACSAVPQPTCKKNIYTYFIHFTNLHVKMSLRKFMKFY
jgi:hypothetical protein